MSEFTFEALFEQVQKLSALERLRMLELLVATLQTDLNPKPDRHAALSATYGILADNTIERPTSHRWKSEMQLNEAVALQMLQS